MKRKTIILLSITILYLLIIIFMSVIKDNNVILLGNNTIIIVKNNNIYVKYNEIIKDRNVKFYYNGNIRDGYIYSDNNTENNHYYIVDKKTKMKVSFTDGLVASTGTNKIKIADYKLDSKLDFDENLSRVFDNNLDNSNITILNKYTVDFDSDGESEEFYTCVVKEDTTHNKYYLLFRKDDIITVVDSIVSDRSVPKSTTLSINKFIDFNDDGTYELIAIQKNGNNFPVYYYVYTYENGKFNRIEEE